MSYTPQFEKEYENGWEDFPSEETLITAHALDGYDNALEHIEEYLSDYPIAQTGTMPTASEDELGNIYQYMGETDANYTQGYFYKCMDDGEEPPLYFWARINVQPGGGGGASSLEDLDDVNITSPTDGQVLKYDAENDEWVNGTGGGGGTNAEWTQIQTEGTKIAEIEIDNVLQDVFDSTWSGTHADYELVKNDLPDGTKVFFTDDNMVKTKTVTGTTTAGGNLSLALDSRDYVAISARTQNAADQDVLSVLWINGNTWYAKVLDQSMNIIASATATVTVYYMDL